MVLYDVVYVKLQTSKIQIFVDVVRTVFVNTRVNTALLKFYELQNKIIWDKYLFRVSILLLLLCVTYKNRSCNFAALISLALNDYHKSKQRFIAITFGRILFYIASPLHQNHNTKQERCNFTCIFMFSSFHSFYSNRFVLFKIHT